MTTLKYLFAVTFTIPTRAIFSYKAADLFLELHTGRTASSSQPLAFVLILLKINYYYQRVTYLTFYLERVVKGRYDLMSLTYEFATKLNLR